jgi:DNA-binding winged helix-turn-helix (wHTH) protein
MTGHSVGSRVRFGPFTLDPRSGELHQGAKRLKVPDQSIEILKALLERPSDLVTREELQRRLWPADTFVDFEHGLNAAVRRLRAHWGTRQTLRRSSRRFHGGVIDSSVRVHQKSRPVWRRSNNRTHCTSTC